MVGLNVKGFREEDDIVQSFGIAALWSVYKNKKNHNYAAFHALHQPRDIHTHIVYHCLIQLNDPVNN